jgi:hypothetical protein
MQYPTIKHFIFFSVSFLWFVSLIQSRDTKIPIREEPFRCATCEAFAEQYSSRVSGKMMHPDSQDVNGQNADVSPSDAYKWPGAYRYISENRTDSDGDGLRECRYQIDFSRFIIDGGYSQDEVTVLENELRRCIAMYNEVLHYVGLEFLETTGSDYHIIMSADAPESLGTSSARAVLFGAFNDSNPNFYVRSTKTNFGAFLHLSDGGAPHALYKNPPGDPNIYVYSLNEFDRDDRSYAAASDTFLHELGHLLGLMHTFEALDNTFGTGSGNGKMINWLDFPVIGNPPPAIPSTVFEAEDFALNHWSRSFFNTYMTYDRFSTRSTAVKIPPNVKAFIAHYYGINNPEGAQILLDEARQEFLANSQLARGEIVQETESNDVLEDAFPIQIGKPVLAALSSFGESEEPLEETFLDTNDFFVFDVRHEDAGREIEVSIELASVLYENYYFFHDTEEGKIEYDGDIYLSILGENGQTLYESPEAVEFPSTTFVPQQAGSYYIRISKNNKRQVSKDYMLRTAFTDGLPYNAPSFTPTPTQTPYPTPLVTPTPIPALVSGVDLQVKEVYIVIDDGGGDFDDDVRIDSPEPGQNVRFRMSLFNGGLESVDTYSIQAYLDNQLVVSTQNNSPISNGTYWRWRSDSMTFNEPGVHTARSVVTAEGDLYPENNTFSLEFTVGSVPGTPIPTMTNTPIPAVTPTQTAGIVTVPVYTNQFDEIDDPLASLLEIPGTFAGLNPALTELSDAPPVNGEDFDVEGNMLHITTNPAEGTFILLQHQRAIPAENKVLARASVLTTDSSAQVFFGVIDVRENGELTGQVLGMDQITQTNTLENRWRRLTTLHEPQSGYVLPFVQVVGGNKPSEIYIDNIEVYVIDPNQLYPGSFLGAE